MRKILATLTLIVALGMTAASCASEAGSPDSKTASGTKTAQTDEVSYELGETTTKVFTNSIGTVWAVGIAPLKNTGSCDLYISNVSMDIEDADGGLVDTMTIASSTPTVISPGETAVLYGESTVDAEGDYKIVATYKAVKAKIPNTRYPASDIKVTEDSTYGSVEVIGRVENDSDEDEMIEVAVIFYAADGSILGAYDTLTDEVAAGSKSSFKITTLYSANEIAFADIDHYDVIAYPSLQIQF